MDRAQSTPMDGPSARGFAEEWSAYLQQHGHAVGQSAWGPGVAFSINGRGRSYRWLLAATAGNSLPLTTALRKHIRRHARLSGIAGQECFLVIRFRGPEETLLVLPGTEALKRERLKADPGGIPWGH